MAIQERHSGPPAQLSPDEIRARVARLPRIPFAFTPTPLESAPKLAAALSRDQLFIKRDDLTGFAFGGNKVRALEFRMADARAKSCDAFTVTNIGQSNHARLHSAACTRLGMKMVIVKPSPADEEVNGNLLLDRMLGVEIFEAHGRKMDEALDEVDGRLRAEGFTPYHSTREPFSRLSGTVAYLEASIELRDQLRAAGVDTSRVHLFLVHGTSAAGLALGGKLLGLGWRVHAVSYSGSHEAVVDMELTQAARVADLLELPERLDPDDFDVHDQYFGSRYADVTPATLEAIRLAARTDVIFCDPVYTGKGLAGLIGEVRGGRVPADAVPVFIHTGGLPIIFAYHQLLKDL